MTFLTQVCFPSRMPVRVSLFEMKEKGRFANSLYKP